MIAFGLSAFLLARYLPVVTFNLPDWVGWLICAAGFSWAFAAGALFMARKTPVEPRRNPTVLLVEGPFRVNRNPIYTGMTIVLVGWACVLGAASAFVPALLFPLLITWRFVLGEERRLIATFGHDAEAYLSRTRWW
jgi:protein-S-isoprenylcysteine O-methyltransferase Ste14